MASAMFLSDLNGAASTMELPVLRGRYVTAPYGSLSRQSLPTDAIGNFALTLTNLVIGSIYELEPLAGGASLTIGTATTSSVTLNLFVYSGGTAANTLRVKVRHGSGSPFYQPYETQVVAVNGATSLYVNQLIDE